MSLLFLIDFQEVEGEGSPPTSADNVCFTKYGMGKGANFRGGSVGLSQAVAVDMCRCRVSLTVWPVTVDCGNACAERGRGARVLTGLLGCQASDFVAGAVFVVLCA